MAQGLFDPKEVVKKYVDELEKVGIRPREILLFGSYAQNKADEWSDIDLVVISDDFDRIPPLDRLEILSLATWRVDAPIEATGYSPKEIEEHGKDSIFWEEISTTGKEIYKRAV